MQLIIDQGNSACKLALYDGDTLVSTETIASLGEDILRDLFERYNIEACIYSSVGIEDRGSKSMLASLSPFFLTLDSETEVPISLLYDRTNLGGDRLAAVCGAYALIGKGSDALIIDAGTALTCEYLDADGRYIGGNISPGLHLRAKALKHFTSRLPLIDDLESESWINGYGKDTRSAISKGVVRGFLEEIRAYIHSIKEQNENALILLTGGDAPFVIKHLPIDDTIRWVPELVLCGLHEILKYNLKKAKNRPSQI